MGKLGIGMGLGIIYVSLWGAVTYRTAANFGYYVLNQEGNRAQQSLSRLEFLWKPVASFVSIWPNSRFNNRLKAVNELVLNLDEVIGLKGKRRYLVLMQNNMELRPTGGFMGSYAVVEFDQGAMTRLQIEDIYTPDGQIKGYVPEPKPIREYLFNQNHPGWRLRDANWHPDFPEAARAIEWFFKEGGVSPIDGIAAVTLTPLVKIIDGLGGIKLTDYEGLEITSDNFYQQAQTKAEINFFPGSTQKKDFLGSVTRQLLNQITQNPPQIPVVAKALVEGLIHKEVSIFLPKATGQYWIKAGWDGSLQQAEADYLMINEANLGITKANCCIRRQLTDEITKSDGKIKHQLRLKYWNDNPAMPTPPETWGGGYKNYLRIIVPKQSLLVSITVAGQTIDTSPIDEEVFEDKKMYGFLVLIEGGQEAEVKVDYVVEPTWGNRYSLLFQKQSGIDKWPVEISSKGTKINKEVNADEIYRLSL